MLLFFMPDYQELFDYNFAMMEAPAEDEAARKAHHDYHARIILKCVLQLELIQVRGLW